MSTLLPETIILSAPQRSESSPSWPDYRAIWRWHFYAGLFCIPFVIVLSVTGSIYLFKTEIEAWTDWPYDHLRINGQVHSAADQVRAALAAFPGATFSSYEVPANEQSAGRVIVRRQGESLRVYVHPEALEVLQMVPDQQRLMRQMFRLHGELWMGDRGSNLVELASSWTIILILTGLVLWWPRNAHGLGGALYPRLRRGRGIFWRDIHSVTGVWISCLALFLLVTGLPWAKFWGDYFKSVRRWTGTAVAQQDWSNGSERSLGATRGGAGEHGEHGGGRGRRRQGDASGPIDYEALDRVVGSVAPLGLPSPVVISPPARDGGDWSVKSMTPNRPRRVNLTVNGQTGEIVSRENFRDRHIVDQIVGFGIAAHEGRLFGWPNQMLGLLTAAGLVLLSVSGVVMWWRRRDTAVLGAPKALIPPRWSFGLVAIVLLLGIALPLFGLSLLLVLALEWMLLRRIPPVARWLGLRARTAT